MVSEEEKKWICASVGLYPVLGAAGFDQKSFSSGTGSYKEV